MTEKTNIRIVDIAQMAGVSVGTVDRVLHNRGRVSEEKRLKIEKVLKEINYEPNMVARLLASKHIYRLVAIIPSFVEGDYWSSVSNGINRAVNELKKFNVKVEYMYFDQARKESFPQISEALKEEEYDGVLIATLFGDYVIEMSQVLDAKEIPYVYIDSNIPNQKNLAYFGADSLVSGSVAAKLMLRETGLDNDIIIAQIINNKEVSTQMQNRETGFRDYLKNNGYTGTIYRIELKPNDYLQSLETLKQIISTSGSLVGGIVFNSRIYELAFLLEQLDENFQSKMKLIGYDAIPKNVEAMKKDKISFLIAQHSENQGYEGIRCLSNNLLFKQTANKINLMPIDILIKENVDYYYNYKL
jgi:Transcriptional regulators